MARSWLIDSRGLAKKVINAGQPAAYQIQDCGANTHCPNCHHRIGNTDMVSQDWPGFPAGVKFDPSDVELLQHLAAKIGVGISDSHAFIDDFIPTLEYNAGICYSHPENLPGATKDGRCVYFFYRISNAYSSGRRKRRRIQDHDSTMKSNVRWHKTGKTKPVMQNGILKGFKKIMVLYGTGSKPDKCNWIMHQYHLGTDEDEKEGEYVVSKISYQPEKATNTNTNENPSLAVKEELDVKIVQETPMTPQTTTPNPPRQDKTPYTDCLSEHYFLPSFLQETEHIQKPSHASYSSRMGDDDYETCLDNLLRNDIIDPYAAFGDSSTQVNLDTSLLDKDANASYGIGELDNLELDTPPEFQNLQFDSQDSVFGSLDRL